MHFCCFLKSIISLVFFIAHFNFNIRMVIWRHWIFRMTPLLCSYYISSVGIFYFKLLPCIFVWNCYFAEAFINCTYDMFVITSVFLCFVNISFLYIYIFFNAWYSYEMRGLTFPQTRFKHSILKLFYFKLILCILEWKF